MKVTFVTLNYAPSLGGAQALVREIAEGLAKRYDHEVDVVTTDAVKAPAARNAGRVPHGRRELLGGVAVHRYRYSRRMHTLGRLWRRFRLRINPKRSLPLAGPIRLGPLGIRLHLAVWSACWRSDVVVICPAPALTMTTAAWCPFPRARRVLISLLHQPEGGPHELVGSSVLRRFDAVVALTDFERAVLIELGVDRAAVHVLPPGCHPDRYPPRTPTEARQEAGLPDRTTVGYLGRLTAYKGVDTILAATPRLFEAQPKLTVLLAGVAHGRLELEPVLEHAGDRLVIREGFSDDERALLLAACDVVLTPSRGESFGMVTIEAWAARRPVIAGDIPAVRELVRPGVDGLLVPPGRPEELVAATLALLDDEIWARRMGEAGRVRAEEEFAWDRLVDRWQELLGTFDAGQG